MACYIIGRNKSCNVHNNSGLNLIIPCRLSNVIACTLIRYMAPHNNVSRFSSTSYIGTETNHYVLRKSIQNATFTLMTEHYKLNDFHAVCKKYAVDWLMWRCGQKLLSSHISKHLAFDWTFQVVQNPEPLRSSTGFATCLVPTKYNEAVQSLFGSGSRQRQACLVIETEHWSHRLQLHSPARASLLLLRPVSKRSSSSSGVAHAGAAPLFNQTQKCYFIVATQCQLLSRLNAKIVEENRIPWTRNL